MHRPPSLHNMPADGMLKRAVEQVFSTLADELMGMIVLDREHRIVWANEGYQRFVALGPFSSSGVIGRRIQEVVPNSQMGEVIDSGRAIPIDLLTNQYGSFLVSRLPLRDDGGQVIGGLALVFLDRPDTTMQPLMHKFTRLQRQLDDARRQLAVQRRAKYSIAGFVGASVAAMQVKRHAWRVAQTDSTVLLLGETGTGKELLAQGIHAASARAAGAFVGVNIAAIPDTLLEAEFFGAAPGAYTGAERKGRNGKFKIADGGTLFLDEIGDMPLALQAKFLRVLQEQEVEPLGSNEVQHIDVRFIAATSCDLASIVAAGSFRADLYYRLNVFPIRLPALRERIEDIEALVETLAEDIARDSGVAHKVLTPAALELLARQHWRGNVRELRNVLEQANLMTDEPVLDARHFSTFSGVAATHSEGAAASMPPPGHGVVAAPLAHVLAQAQHDAIDHALAASGGNKAAAARALGISRSALYGKLAVRRR